MSFECIYTGWPKKNAPKFNLVIISKTLIALTYLIYSATVCKISSWTMKYSMRYKIFSKSIKISQLFKFNRNSILSLTIIYHKNISNYEIFVYSNKFISISGNIIRFKIIKTKLKLEFKKVYQHTQTYLHYKI